MSDRQSPVSPQLYARTCGLLYLYIIVAGISAEMLVRSRIIVPTDAAATAANIAAHETLFRVGFAAELLQLAFDVAVAMLLYALFRPVNRNIALLAAFMRLSCAITLGVASTVHLAALRLLKGGDYLAGLLPEQLQSLALLALKLHGDAYAVALVFFGFACIALGYLIIKSTYFPGTIGLLMAIAGVGYLVNSFANFIDPPLAGMLYPAILMPALVAELALALWLLLKGVNVEKWTASVAAEQPG